MPQDKAYSLLDRILHRVVLSKPSIGEILLQNEENKFPELNVKNHKIDSVFICGLARSGSTILMRELYDSGQFASLTYRDMPFVLAPNFWKQITKHSSREIKDVERAHGDNLLVNFDSPEALDEVFWRTLLKGKYIREDAVHTHSVKKSDVERFEFYLKRICYKYNKNRYLSKNNNNITRIRGLSEHMPNAIFLIPIRNPFDHAFSLWSQHKRFSESDKFTRSYMTWLAHHEFGAVHKPFQFGDNVKSSYGPIAFEYWLERWYDCYNHLKDEIVPHQNQIRFVVYEQFCKDARYRTAVKAFAGTHDKSTQLRSPQARKRFDVQNSQLLYNCEALYAAIRDRSVKKMTG